jgi:hypothetical protein
MGLLSPDYYYFNGNSPKRQEKVEDFQGFCEKHALYSDAKRGFPHPEENSPPQKEKVLYFSRCHCEAA